ncbi:hypothetical protein [Cutibacterium equinum]|uniref:hypothetical protein n=1 Tax=Cutibacterium equinum TaxID=3016342 RepID=UPI0038CD966F
MHASYIRMIYHSVALWSWLIWVNNLMGPYRMPLLMCLSGRALRKPIKAFYLGKMRGLLWPYLL